MLNINYEKGNLITLFKEKRFDAIAHQANCQGVYGAGIAFSLVKEFPQLLNADKMMEKELKPGGFTLLNTEYGSIINLYGQVYPGGIPSQTEDYRSRINLLHNSIVAFFEKWFKDNQSLNLGIPLLASGIAADQDIKGNKDDLYYFKNYVEYLFFISASKFIEKDITITVVYL